MMSKFIAPPSDDAQQVTHVAGGTADLFELGLASFRNNALHEAQRCFQAAHDADPGHARARSYLGVCVALGERRLDEAVALCTSASKQEFYNPEVYLNLARVYLSFGFKVEGRRYLLRGQMIDPANAEINQALGRLGQRVSPVLPFLPRRHFINRWLGTAKHALAPGERSQVAA
ncbi:MAG: Flp pilus assembly protein TadD [Myxococcota bacterium]|jgi:Flp pilus assembly protein TadD